MRKTSSFGGLVYSTDAGRMCPACRQPVAACRCATVRAAAAASAGDGIARVRREVGGRGGKTVTTVAGLALGEVELVALAKRLKVACGTGGTIKGGILELQGDHVDALLSLLTKEGFKSKRAGG